MSAPKPPPGFTASQWALVERSIADGTIPTSPEEPAKSGAPKARPAISGETTLRELEEILRAHRVEGLMASFATRVVEVSLDDAEWHRGDLDGSLRYDLAGAIRAALRTLRIEQAEELDLTDEEART